MCCGVQVFFTCLVMVLSLFACVILYISFYMLRRAAATLEALNTDPNKEQTRQDWPIKFEFMAPVPNPLVFQK